MNDFILSLDQGTTSSRAIVFDRNGLPVSTAQQEFTQIYPKPGWVEHDPEEIWSSQSEVALKALADAGLTGRDIAAIGITNQRETTIVWNRKTGKPVYNAIVWQDRRTADFCDQLKKEGRSQEIQEKTGLIIDAYFSATKIRWILDNVDGARRMAGEGTLAFGTVDTWLIWNLTGGKSHITDVSNASRTMLFNIHSLKWDDGLLEIFGIPAGLLPEVRSSSEVYCATERLFPASVPIAGIAGDQQAALFGQMCTEPGMVKNTYGTGCFMVMNIGKKPIESKNKLLTTIAWQINGETHYALEGSIFIAGAVVQWLRDGLGIIGKSSDVEKLASEVSDSGGVCFVPAFAGLGAPHWDQHATGTIVGITRGTTAAHIARAAVESIAFQTLDVLKAMENDSGIRIRELRVDGGAAVNNLLMQFQSDVLQARVVRPSLTETTALGAAYLAGLSVGYWKDIEELRNQWQVGMIFSPMKGAEATEVIIKEWHRAVKAALAWASSS
ncbi:MAG: glycerol kinase GlpK [Bacteroidales bacterium]|jgi:glycerol kinase|nr:glycerol kinase GlpK [Bacteroidales bacterium]